MKVKKHVRGNRPFTAGLALVWVFTFAGLADAQVTTGQSRQGITKKDNVRLWTENGNVVPVCWETPGYSREKAIFRDAIANTWERHANLRFTGWTACPTGGIGGSATEKHVRIRIKPQGSTNSGAGGSARLGMGALSSADENDPGVNLSFNPDGTADQGRVEYIAVHEFGHVLGFVHEQDTPGNVQHGVAYCKSSGNEDNATSLTDYDPDSVMNYCNKDLNMKGNLTDKDITGLRKVYGVKVVGRAPGASSILSICESALEARARNSPAAYGLEGQCRAFVSGLAAKGEAIANQDPAAVALRNRQPDASARRGFDIGMAAAEGQTIDGPGKQAIHDSLPASEQAGYAAAVSFSLARNTDLEGKRKEELAARGAEVAKRDPLAVELRNRLREEDVRRGFDIGMGAAEGQTEWGPGKQRILDSLPSRAERIGFETATSFSLERNRYADRAARGAAIAAADPVVAEARNAIPGRMTFVSVVFWRLGFDIATAIFGNPALGAQGNTAMGPGSTEIRNSLRPEAQAGFDAAVKLHLSRKY